MTLTAARASRGRWVLARTLALTLAIALLAACGLSLDEAPREISLQDLPRELRPGQLPTPTSMPASLSGPGREQIFMVQDGDRLVTVERQIVDTPEQLLNILLLGTFPVERADGIESALFRETAIQGVEVNDLFDLAIVDLAPGSLDPRNSEQRLAFAQIVYSITSLPGIEAVQFVQTDPENPDAGATELPVQTDNGTTLPGARVTRDDFSRLAPSSVPVPAFDIPIATPTPTPDPDAPPKFDVAIWMLDDNEKLTKVSRRIERTPEAYLVAVLEGPLVAEREEQQIRSAVPPDALANGITVEPFDVEQTDEFGFTSLEKLNIALVDLKPGSLPSVDDGNQRLLAAAQIVFTLTDLTEIDQVVFSVDGVFIPNPSDDGLTLPFDRNIPNGVDKSDYQTAVLRPTEPGTIPPAAIQPTATPTVEPDAGISGEPTPTPPG